MRALVLNLPAGTGPRYLRIARAIREALARGLATPGEKLPSTRELAESFKVHRNTIAAALAELQTEGWIVGEERKTFRVAAVLPTDYFRSGGGSGGGRQRSPRTHVWDFARGVDLDPFAPRSEVRFNFEAGLPDFTLFPMREFRAHLTDVLRRPQPAILDYGDPSGYPSLVRALEDYLRRMRGLTGRRIIVTNGSQEAIFLAAQLLIRPGDSVAMEELTYPPARETYRAAGARVIAVPMDEDGIDVDAFERLARRNTIRMLFLTPLHQFPTTVILPVAKRMRITEIAARHGIAIFEDDYDHEFHYRTAPPPPLASYDPEERVIYASTLSKVLFPSARLGFLVVPHGLARNLLQFRRIVTHQNDSIVQDAIARWFQSGGMERHLRRMRRHYEARRDAMVEQLTRAQQHAGWSWKTPDGGMALWLDLHRDAHRIAQQARKAGLFVAHEGSFRIDPGPARHLRLGFSSLAAEEMEAGIALLAKIVQRR